MSLSHYWHTLGCAVKHFLLLKHTLSSDERMTVLRRTGSTEYRTFNTQHGHIKDENCRKIMKLLRWYSTSDSSSSAAASQFDQPTYLTVSAAMIIIASRCILYKNRCMILSPRSVVANHVYPFSGHVEHLIWQKMQLLKTYLCHWRKFWEIPGKELAPRALS